MRPHTIKKPKRRDGIGCMRGGEGSDLRFSALKLGHGIVSAHAGAGLASGRIRMGRGKVSLAHPSSTHRDHDDIMHASELAPLAEHGFISDRPCRNRNVLTVMKVHAPQGSVMHEHQCRSIATLFRQAFVLNGWRALC